MRVAGIVDHDVDAAECVGGCGNHGVDVILSRNVDGDGNGLVPDLASHTFRADSVDVGDDDAGALLGEPFRDPLAETGRCAGDDCDLAFQSGHASHP